MKKLLMFLLLGMFLISFASAGFEFDNVKDERSVTWDGQSIVGNHLLEKYKPIEIKNSFGFGSTIFSGYLSQHTDICIIDCSSTIEIELKEEIPLVDAIDFYIILEDDSRVKKNVESYELYLKDGETEHDVIDYKLECSTGGWNDSIQEFNEVCEYVEDGVHTETNDNWIPYTIGDSVPEGEYTLKITAKKGIGETIDWIIKTSGETLSEWAAWEPSFNVDLKAYYSFEENTGITTEDVTGNGNDLVGVNTPGWTSDGIEGNSIDLNRTAEEYFENDTALLLALPITVNVWVNASSSNIWQPILQKSVNSGASDDSRFMIRQDDAVNFIGSQTRTTGTNHAYPAGAIDVGNWHMVTLVTNSTGIAMFYDGSPFVYTENANPLAFSSNYKLLIGGYFDGTISSFFDGRIDELAVWSRGLSESEISDLWNGGTGIFYIQGDVVTLNSPENASTSVIAKTQFNATGAPPGGATVTNMSLYTDETGSWAVRNITTGLSGTETIQLWNRTLSIGTILWNVEACDSTGACEFAPTNSTFTLSLVDVNSQTYPTTSVESATETYIVNLNYNSTAFSIITGVLYLNGTQYLGDRTGAGDNAIFTTDAIMPPVTEETVFDSHWVIGLTNSSGITTINLTSNNVTVSIINLSLCDNPLTVPFWNFTILNETNIIEINSTFDVTFSVSALGSSETNEFSFSDSSGTNSTFDFCMSPVTESYTADASIKLTKVGFVDKFYNYQDVGLSNTTRTDNLYMMSSADSTSFIVHVVYVNSKDVEQAEVRVQRYYQGTGEWLTTEILTTNYVGEAVGHLLAEDADYRFLVYQGGLSIYNSTGTKITCAISPCTVTLVLPIDILTGVETVQDLEAIITFSQTTNTFTYTYSDTSSDFSRARLEVIRVWPSNSTLVIPCNETKVTISGVMTCDISGQINGTYKASGYITRTGAEFLAARRDGTLGTEIYNAMGNDGLLWAFFVLIGIIMIGISRPSLAIIFGAAGIVILSVLQIVNIGIVSIIAIAAIAIILLMKVGRE